MKDYDMDNGLISFGTPSEGMISFIVCRHLHLHVWVFSGAEFSYWSGGYVRDGVAVLVCFALNSYHSVTTYKWCHNGTPDVCNPYPLLYAETCGLYECVMESIGGIEKVHKFTVLGISIYKI